MQKQSYAKGVKQQPKDWVSVAGFVALFGKAGFTAVVLSPRFAAAAQRRRENSSMVKPASFTILPIVNALIGL